MKSSVITNEESSAHFIENYRFKVLGTHDHHAREEQNLSQEQDEAPLEPRQVVQQPQQVAPAPVISSGFDASFVEELLKKTDELSGNIVKLQMQIENQEAEFNRRLEAEVLRAKDDGIAEGKAQANEQFQAEVATLNERFSSSINKLSNFYNTLEEFLQKSEDELATAAIGVAKQVIVKEISSSSANVALSLSKALISELRDAKNITIRVNPIDAQFLSENFQSNDHIKIEADDAISKGGVVIISEAGNIDGSIENRLEKLKSLM
ncbi:flagellar assembly protein FliH [Campylobacter mucosalis]|uniref:Flagellar assembly protein FliH n=1 Tax=Campylobacter mucosalis CCUG 21559 TaxID=1032067 RepID=A0A6G5QEB0_9BACT|nr:flagellar assembly protein FliH [Campylobacter mucosalis]QCD43991.1 flagellar export apparatus, flagellar assembly protein FliH [Campylobacter mucosalis CCUG 21559]